MRAGQGRAAPGTQGTAPLRRRAAEQGKPRIEPASPASGLLTGPGTGAEGLVPSCSELAV